VIGLGEKTQSVHVFILTSQIEKEQSAVSILSSLLRQVIGGQEGIPEEISQAFPEERNAIGRRGLRLPDAVKMLQAIASSLRTFV